LRWEDKKNKLFWRGAFMVDLRKELWEVARKYSWGAQPSVLFSLSGRY
jgi:hypothetical protein